MSNPKATPPTGDGRKCLYCHTEITWLQIEIARSRGQVAKYCSPGHRALENQRVQRGRQKLNRDGVQPAA